MLRKNKNKNLIQLLTRKELFKEICLSGDRGEKGGMEEKVGGKKNLSSC